MSQYTNEELSVIIKKHGLWLRSKKDGERAVFSGDDLSNVRLDSVNLRGAYIRDVNLQGASLVDVNLLGAKIARSDLQRIYLDDVNLSGAYLEQANLSNAMIFNSDLQKIYLEQANLQGTDFQDTRLCYASLAGADMAGTKLNNTTVIGVHGKQVLTYVNGRHTAIYVDGFISIGCQTHPVSHWLKNYMELGNKHHYSEEKINNYGNWIKYIATLGD